MLIRLSQAGTAKWSTVELACRARGLKNRLEQLPYGPNTRETTTVVRV